MAKILITGANGFIGGYLRDHLSKQHQVYAPGRSLLDLTNYHSVNTFFDTNEVDVVVHCALIGRNNTNSVDDSLAIGNMNMFTNLYRNKHKFKMLINMGTGNEFDTTVNNNNAAESTLFGRMPIASYGYAKNMIARCINDTDNMYNMRLFGVFGNREAAPRFFKRLKNATDNFHIFQDCYFDFFWVEDLFPIVDRIIKGDMPYRDFNCTYTEKYLMSELAYKFAEIHNIDRNLIKVDARSLVNFSGSSNKLDHLCLNLQGLEAGFRSYV
jgi:GDP-L-fucose synthase